MRGRSVWIAGVDPAVIVHGRIAQRRPELGSPRPADLRILLCHYPQVLDRLEPGRFDLVLAGHMHDGQISVPYPGGKLRLAHLTARYTSALYRERAATMHVSPGLGTTFVPFRFAVAARGDGARAQSAELG